MACPDADLLVAMVEQQLDPARFADIELYIDTCELCRKVIAAALLGKSIAAGTPTVLDVPKRSAR